MTHDSPSPFDILHPQPLLIVISGPSGVGKDTVVHHKLAASEPERWVIVDANQPPEAVQAAALKIILGRLKSRE